MTFYHTEIKGPIALTRLCTLQSLVGVARGGEEREEKGILTWTEKVVCDLDAYDLSPVVANAEDPCLDSEPAEVAAKGARDGGFTTCRQAMQVQENMGGEEGEREQQQQGVLKWETRGGADRCAGW